MIAAVDAGEREIAWCKLLGESESNSMLAAYMRLAVSGYQRMGEITQCESLGGLNPALAVSLHELSHTWV